MKGSGRCVLLTLNFFAPAAAFLGGFEVLYWLVWMDIMTVPIRAIAMHACYNDDDFNSRAVVCANFRQLCDDCDEKEALLPKPVNPAQQRITVAINNIIQNLHRRMTEQTRQE